MNRAFTHATDGDDMTVAYYASSQMLVFTAEPFGMPKIVQALKLWGEGKRTPEVIKTRVRRVAPSDYDASYRAWQLARLARYDGQFIRRRTAAPARRRQGEERRRRRRTRRARRHTALSLLHARKRDEAQGRARRGARSSTRRSRRRTTSRAGSRSSKKDVRRRQAQLDAMIATRATDGYPVQMALASSPRRRRTRRRFARRSRRRTASIRRSRSRSRALRHRAKRRSATPTSSISLRQLAHARPARPQVWRMLLDRLVDAEAVGRGAKVGESARSSSTSRAAADAHRTTRARCSAGGQHDKAVFELESALLCSGPPKDRAAANALLAKEGCSLKNTERGEDTATMRR